MEDINKPFTYSEHALTRMQQRGIRKEHVDIVLAHGVCYNKQGLIFLAVISKDLPETISKQLVDKVASLVVLCKPTYKSNIIITVYKRKNPHKFIKHKRKNIVRWKRQK
jgi:hypothetical protein